MNSFVVGLIISFVSTFKRLVFSRSIKQFGTNCRFLQMGRIVAFSKWDELTLGTNCRFLEFVTNCRLGRIVAWDELSPNLHQLRWCYGQKFTCSFKRIQISKYKHMYFNYISRSFPHLLNGLIVLPG